MTALDAVVRRRHLGWIGSGPALGTDDVRPPRWDHGPVVAVDVDASVSRGAVDIIANRALWPALHGLDTLVDWQSSSWPDYLDYNLRFATAIIGASAPGDIVWVHDYHLLLVPAMVAERTSDRIIVLSIHTPIDLAVGDLPDAADLIAGMAGADLIGVQTERDADALRRLFRDFIPDGRGLPEVIVSPVSIDPAKLACRSRTTASRAARTRLADAHAGRRIIVSIDRLDYTKGVPERLDALDLAFRRGWLDPKLTQYIGVAQPTRSNVPIYRQLRVHTERLAHDLTARWQRSDGTSPIDLRFESVGPGQVAALLSIADVCAVTPWCDGMNLVAKEFSALAKDDSVLVLSNGAGAHEELGSWSVTVDGSQAASIAQGLRIATELDLGTRHRWTSARRSQVAIRTASRWADDLLGRAGLVDVTYDQDVGEE